MTKKEPYQGLFDKINNITTTKKESIVDNIINILSNRNMNVGKQDYYGIWFVEKHDEPVVLRYEEEIKKNIIKYEKRIYSILVKYDIKTKILYINYSWDNYEKKEINKISYLL